MSQHQRSPGPHWGSLAEAEIGPTTAFNLSFYTDPSDLSRLIPLLDRDRRLLKFSALNQAICDLVDDFGLVGFETLCVEASLVLSTPRDANPVPNTDAISLVTQDKESMMHLVRTVDQALGYVAPMTQSPSTKGHSDSSHGHRDYRHHHDDEDDHDHAHAHAPRHVHAHPPTTPADLSRLSRATDVQEKWLDHVEQYAEHERALWAGEGDWARQRANEANRRAAGVREDLVRLPEEQ